jgi:hypothetical protein
VQLSPDARTGAERQQTNRFAAAAQRHHEQPSALVLAALGITHHRSGAVINLRLLAGRGKDNDAGFGGLRSTPPAHEALHALLAKPYSETRSCQIAMALRPRLGPKSMASRYGSQALGPGTTAQSVITWFSLAGFEVAFAFPLLERFSGLGLQLGSRGSGTTGIAGFAAPVGDHFVGRSWCAPPPSTGRTHRNPRRFQVRACGFATEIRSLAGCAAATSPAVPELRLVVSSLRSRHWPCPRSLQASAGINVPDATLVVFR